VIFYTIIAPFYADTGLAITPDWMLGGMFGIGGATPDWMLGGMFGIGGAAGMYVGARLQRFIPARVIKAILALLMLFIAVKYIAGAL